MIGPSDATFFTASATNLAGPPASRCGPRPAGHSGRRACSQPRVRPRTLLSAHPGTQNVALHHGYALRQPLAGPRRPRGGRQPCAAQGRPRAPRAPLLLRPAAVGTLCERGAPGRTHLGIEHTPPTRKPGIVSAANRRRFPGARKHLSPVRAHSNGRLAAGRATPLIAALHAFPHSSDDFGIHVRQRARVRDRTPAAGSREMQAFSVGPNRKLPTCLYGTP